MTIEELKAKADAAVVAALAEGKSQSEADVIHAQIMKEQTTDPVQTELERIRVKKSKILHRKKILEKELEDLGGVDDDLDDDDVDDDPLAGQDDNKPVTVGDLKRIQKSTATKNAMQLADELENESDRELAKYHLKNTIRSTGNPAEDLRLALVHVYAVRNSKIIEENTRRGEPKRTSSNSGGGSGSSQYAGKEQDLTPEEIPYTLPPFNMTKAAIIAARPKE